MSDSDDCVPRTVKRTKPLPKNQQGLFAPKESFLNADLDKNCLYNFKDNLVRIEFPGNVKNVEKAIELLGGIDEIQKAANNGAKLELTFHPKNLFNNGCVADTDKNCGILIKVKQNRETNETSYEVLGAVDANFKFNRMCDFQYLPLVPKDRKMPESKESEVENLQSKIVLDNLPTLEWFNTRELGGETLFLTSGNFARSFFDVPQGKFYSDSTEIFNAMARNEEPHLPEGGKKMQKRKNFKSAIRMHFQNKDLEVPAEPLPQCFDNINTSFLRKQLQIVRKVFEERPIWTKPGVMHRANVNVDSFKQILPCLAYYCPAGPWRTCWIKFGYNPMKDVSSRVYQVLDFRIRHTEGTQLRVKSKRTIYNNLSKEWKNKVYDPSSDVNYIIKPNIIPPARQMFYQYCDILIPEIQEMITKLPKLPATAKFDPKNGWLPLSFQEHCREIVNRYVFDAVQQELLKETRAPKESHPVNVATYCSKMLSNIRKGVSQSIGEYSGSSQKAVVEEIDLSDEEEIDAKQMMDNLPERLREIYDDDEESDLEIDMEAVEEVNEIVAGIKEQKLDL